MSPDAVAKLDHEVCYRAVRSRDRRFDGMFWTAVHSTGIYCRPSCPARTPRPSGVTFHASAASAQRAGYRACKRCLPDATPGSPQWDLAADAAGRAMRLINDGLVDRESVEGLSAALGYSPRQLGRILTTQLGAGPLALARARRAQTARALLESTDLPTTDVAFAAGFASVRQFNDTFREVYATSPRDLRGSRVSGAHTGPVSLRIPVRAPYATTAMLAFLAFHVVAGVEAVHGGVYARTVALPHGPGVIAVDLAESAEQRGGGRGILQIPVRLWLSDLRDTTAASERVRRLLDADADIAAIDAHLGADPRLGELARHTPGLRVPGSVDGAETAFRTVIGQQVSVAGARTVTERLVRRSGAELPAALREAVREAAPGLTHVFPSAEALAAIEPEDLSMPRARGRALQGLARAIAAGELRLDRGPEREAVRTQMLALAGIGPWTADCVALRALGHPDAFLNGDVGVRRAAANVGLGTLEPADVEAWRPWRSYALMHLWNTLMPPSPLGVEEE